MHFYTAARRLALDIDIVHHTHPLDGYELIIVPGNSILDEHGVDALLQADATVIIGPRSASRMADGSQPPNLAPGSLQTRLPLRVVAVDSMRPGAKRHIKDTTFKGEITRWFEQIDTDLTPRLRCDDGTGFWFSQDRAHYLNGFPDADLLMSIIESAASERGHATMRLPEGLRIRKRGHLTFAFNASPKKRSFQPDCGKLLLGLKELSQGSFSVWDCSLDSSGFDA